MHEIIEMYQPTRKQPEFLLWLAVVNRAVYDYIDAEEEKRTGKIRKKQPYSYNCNWFLFCQDNRPHNLTWISNILYGGTGFAEKVRKHLRNLSDKDISKYSSSKITRRRIGRTTF
jgi:hypothetical protein